MLAFLGSLGWKTFQASPSSAMLGLCSGPLHLWPAQVPLSVSPMPTPDTASRSPVLSLTAQL